MPVIFGIKSWQSILYTIIMLLLLFLPAKLGMPAYDSKIYRSVALFFDTEVYMADDPEKYRKNKKPFMFLIFPHGIVSFGALCSCIIPDLKQKTVVADALTKFPILRQLFSPFNLISPHKKKIVEELKEKKAYVSIHPGGLAELFLSSPDEEYSYFNHRAGCVAAAMEAGCDICLLYIYGNTATYRLKLLASERISRMFRISITFFTGKFFSFIPNKTKMVQVYSKIIPVKDCRDRKPTVEEIKEEHQRILGLLIKHYNANRHLHPDYKNKDLKFV